MKAEPTSIETIDSKVLNLAMQDFSWHQVEEFFEGDDTSQVQGINLVEYTAHSEEILQAGLNRLTGQLDPALNSAPEQNPKRLGYSIAMGDSAVKKIWAMRKRAVGLLGNAKGEARPIPFVEDTAVPPEHLADFILEFREILDAYHLDYGMFGHVDAGVLHVRPAIDMKDPEQEKMAWEISDRIAALTQQYHGLLWGEHGKGVRSEYAPEFFGELYPQLQRIKGAFDPRNQLNPGKIATPDASIALIAIDEFPTRGQRDRDIPVKMWNQFSDAVYCNGNGACFNWNANDAMCPSWKATRERTQSPKGRASLLREWMTLVSQSGKQTALTAHTTFTQRLVNFPRKLVQRRNSYDFSHEVYDSMATCLACKSCAGQCPIKVNVPEFRSQFLALYHTRYWRPLKDYLVGGLESLLPLCAKVPGLYNLLMGLPPSKYVLEKWVGFVDGPQLAPKGLNTLPFADAATLTTLSDEEKGRSVIIVQDAFTSYFEAQLLVDIVALLKNLGFNPLVAPYKANGKPLHVHGFLSAFAKTAEKNSQHLSALAKHGIALVGIDPSMTLTYAGEYPKYVKHHDVPTVVLIQDWLLENIAKATLQKTDDGERYKLLPHCTEASNASASLQKWKALFEAFGHSLEILNVGCCGMSGTFGHEARNKATSQHLYAMSWQAPVEKYAATGQLVATGFSCRSQVKREAQKRIKHPLQVLLKSIEEF